MFSVRRENEVRAGDRLGSHDTFPRTPREFAVNRYPRDPSWGFASKTRVVRRSFVRRASAGWFAAGGTENGVPRMRKRFRALSRSLVGRNVERG